MSWNFSPRSNWVMSPCTRWTRSRSSLLSAARLRAACSSMRSERSRPVTRLPICASAMAMRPVPQPSSRSEEHTSELQSRLHLVCRLLLEKQQRHVPFGLERHGLDDRAEPVGVRVAPGIGTRTVLLYLICRVRRCEIPVHVDLVDHSHVCR